uniref:Uncharacterized protein n=1 Tax=Phytophthora fragariae TaxID=53985 RepID=A0A6A3EN95_9STRA|nr:hypothetical protein PF009_g14984 [Phytophthora fragariae]
MENEEARRMTVSSLGNGGNGACWKLTKPGCFRFRPVPLTRILVSGYTRPLAAYGTIGERSEDIMPTRMNTTTALSTGTTAAQRERLSLYGLPRRPNVFIQQEAAQAPPPPALVGTSPIIGGDYEFVEAQDWPHDIMHVTSNIFTVTQPYPVMQRYSTNVSSNTERDAISNTPAPELLLAAGRKARTNAAPDATDHDQSPAGCLAEHNKALGRPTPLSPRAG